MAILVTNNAAGTLASGISDSDVTLTLTTGQGDKFPDIVGSDYYYLTIVDTGGTTREIVKCTAKTGDTFTIVRGADGPEDPIITTSYAFSTGDRVGLRFCKAMWDALPQLENDNAFVGDNSFDGDVDITGTFNTDGAATLGSTLAVTGATTMAALTASGTATFNGNLKKGSNDVDSFPAGTVMLFMQTTPPTGWTKSLARNNYALRIVTGTVSANDAGSSFTDIFTGRTIARANLPNVTLSVTGSADASGSHTHGLGGAVYYGGSTGSGFPGFDGTGSSYNTTTATQPGGNHSHSVAGTTASINGGVTQTEFDMDVNYADAIVATKA